MTVKKEIVESTSDVPWWDLSINPCKVAIGRDGVVEYFGQRVGVIEQTDRGMWRPQKTVIYGYSTPIAAALMVVEWHVDINKRLEDVKEADADAE